MKTWTTSPRRRGPLALVVLALLLAVAGACEPANAAPMTPAVDTFVTSANPKQASNEDGFLYVRNDAKTHVGYLRYAAKRTADGTYRGTLRITTMERGLNVWVHNTGTVKTWTNYSNRPPLGTKVGFLGWTTASTTHTIELSGVEVKNGQINLGLATSSPGQLRVLSTEGARWIGSMDAAPTLQLTKSTTSSTTTTTTPTTAPPTTAAPTTAAPTTAAPTTAAPTTAAPTTQAPTTTTPTTGVPGGIYVDESRIPAPNPGYSSFRIERATYSKTPDNIGSFRVNCLFSHMNFDDPIVFPGRSRATHLHSFFGNTGARGSSTAASIQGAGNSTCSGGTANRTAYWAPSVIDTRTGAPVTPGGTSQIDRENALQVYYKTGYDGIVPSTVRNFPAGLRMIAGTGSSTTPQDNGIVWYSCFSAGGQQLRSFPSCAPGDLFIMTIEFPQCWDGRNLDSPDHKSHMAYGQGIRYPWPSGAEEWLGCPSSHPVPLPQVTQHFRYRVPAGGMSTWRLSSDMYSGPAGYSGHADWFNGWDAPTFQRVIDNCYRGPYDCSMNLLGDGYVLYD